MSRELYPSLLTTEEAIAALAIPASEFYQLVRDEFGIEITDGDRELWWSEVINRLATKRGNISIVADPCHPH